jgi:hypothetical protein
LKNNGDAGLIALAGIGLLAAKHHFRYFGARGRIALGA